MNFKLDTQTQRKLKEAVFFFGKMKEAYSLIPDFDYYLSAFVSAARAVTLVMVSEYAHTPGFNEWNKSDDWTPEEKVFMDAIKDLRNTTHKKYLPTTLFDIRADNFAFTPDTWADFKEQVERAKAGGIPVRVTRLPDGFMWEAEIDGKLHKFKGSIPASGRRIAELPEKDILEVCSDFLEAVSKVVSECTSKFPL